MGGLSSLCSISASNSSRNAGGASFRHCAIAASISDSLICAASVGSLRRRRGGGEGCSALGTVCPFLSRRQIRLDYSGNREERQTVRRVSKLPARVFLARMK